MKTEDYLVETINKRKQELLKDVEVQKQLLDCKTEKEAKERLFWIAMFTLFFSVDQREEIISKKL